MRPVALVCAVCLISAMAFAQRGGHGGGGSHAGGGGVSHASGFSRGGSAAVRSGGAYRTGAVRGYRPYGYRYGYSRPYYGLGWGFGWDPHFWGWDNNSLYYDSSGYYSDPYAGAGGYESQPPVIVNQVMPYAEPAPPPPPPEPVVREYTKPLSESANYGPVLYLFALKNNNILAAFTYWTEKGDLHYVNLDHQMKQIPLSSIDRELTDRLNRERNLNVRLPG